MGDVKGRSAKVAVSSDGSTYFDCTGAKDFSFGGSRATIDAKDYASGDDDEFLAGTKTAAPGWTINYDEADTGFTKILDAWKDGSDLYLRYRPRGDTVGAKEYIYKGVVTAFGPTSPRDGIAELAVSFQATGAPTIQNQT